MPLVQIKDGSPAIGFKIPDGVIKVEEKMFVFQIGRLIDFFYQPARKPPGGDVYNYKT